MRRNITHGYKKRQTKYKLSLDTKTDGSAQDCSNSIANALELLQSCTKPSKCTSWLTRPTQQPSKLPLSS